MPTCSPAGIYSARINIRGSAMEAIWIWLVSGLLLGLASSLHCAGMCTGISTSLLFMFDTQQSGARVRAMVLAHVGRAISYATIGSVLGALGAGAISSLPPQLAYRMLQWAAAVAMMWIGLSTAGVLPSLAIADRVFAPLSGSVGNFAMSFRFSPLGPLGMGLAWGFMPCAMVYGAYLTAMLTGSAIGGAITMISFALATLPVLAISSLGLRHAAASQNGVLRSVIGLAIAGVGFSGIYFSAAITDFICR